MNSTFYETDVELLLKDISGLVEPLPTEIREKRIQSGVHYCEMLPLEYQPSTKYLEAYRYALQNYAKTTADATAVLAEKLFANKGANLVIVSLARAGTPVGILLKRYIEKKYHVSIKHYSISIIRGRGIDRNAVGHILKHHSAVDVQFVDGWVGKGAIFRELINELALYPDIKPELAVISDPANLTDLCGTHEDFLIPSSCLNATITGLISRTFLRRDIIGKDDFHGAAFLKDLRHADLTNDYLNTIESHFDYHITVPTQQRGRSGLTVVENIAKVYGIKDINYIKPGIGEATRVLLRRVPWKILINPLCEDMDEFRHIRQLALEKSVSVEVSTIDLGNYKVCGIIKNLADI